MRDRRPKTKSEVIADELRRRILAGEFEGGRLPPEPELMAHFNVSRKPILNAMAMLSAEGLLKRVKGTGTFIDGGSPIDIVHRLVVVAMPLHGHYFADLHKSVSKGLEERNLFPVGVDFSTVKSASLAQKANLATLLGSPVRGAIIYGSGYWAYPLLDSVRSIRSVVVDFYDNSGKPPWAAALVDYEEGAYRLGRHLLETGRRRLLFVSSPTNHNGEPAASHRANHPRWQLEKGLRRAIGTFGDGSLAFEGVNPEATDAAAQIGAVLEQPADAIVCNADFIAAMFCEAALAKGKRIPEDLAVTGCYNTDWVDRSPVPLTSIDPLPAELGSLAVELLDKGRSEVRKIAPVVKIRRSSAL